MDLLRTLGTWSFGLAGLLILGWAHWPTIEKRLPWTRAHARMQTASRIVAHLERKHRQLEQKRRDLAPAAFENHLFTVGIDAGEQINLAMENGILDDEVQLLGILRGVDKQAHTTWQKGERNLTYDKFLAFWYWRNDQPGGVLPESDRGDFRPYTLSLLIDFLQSKV